MSINDAAKNIPLIQYLINYSKDYLRSKLNTKNHFLKLNASFPKYYFRTNSSNYTYCAKIFIIFIKEYHNHKISYLK